MGCIYNTFDGICQLWDEDNIEQSPPGCDKKDGACWCDEDPHPHNSCDSYESDSVCHECGADLNIEECTCEDE